MRRIKLACGTSTMVDDEDLEKTKKYKWYLFKNGRGNYVRGLHIKTKQSIYLHRLVMRAQKKDIIDHKNHNALDNRKSNLRICTKQQNCFNQRKRLGSRSKYKGVLYRGYVMRIIINGKRIQKGFNSAKEAAREYDRLARKHFGEFAHTNFP